jgi:hypothetical protein
MMKYFHMNEHEKHCLGVEVKRNMNNSFKLITKNR